MHPIETQNLPMSRSDIDTVRELLRSKPRSTGFAERRERLDAIGSISPVAGDSAGGGLTLALLITLRDSGQPLPGCAWLVSPWVDLQMTGASLADKANVDPLISRSYLEELASAYLADTDPADPLVSPLHADLAGLPPLLVQVGSAETLLDDAVRIARRAGAADVRVSLEIWPEMIHAWHLWVGKLKDARRAIASAGAFIRAQLQWSSEMP